MTAVGRRWTALLLIVAGACAATLFAAGTAFARDAHVRSFDGTKILVHFFPAAGLKAHPHAPTVLMGPGWGQLGSTDQNSKTSTAGGVIGIACFATTATTCSPGTRAGSAAPVALPRLTAPSSKAATCRR